MNPHDWLAPEVVHIVAVWVEVRFTSLLLSRLTAKCRLGLGFALWCDARAWTPCSFDESNTTGVYTCLFLEVCYTMMKKRTGNMLSGRVSQFSDFVRDW